MKRKKWHVIITTALIASMTIQSFAAGWQQNGDSSWSWVLDDNTKLSNSWTQDTDGKWYHLDENGKMQTGWIIDQAGNRYFLNQNAGEPQGSMASGWKMIDNIWYFFNITHDGTFGKALTGWQWIDGYCYYFAADGKMYSNTITPDGFTVDANGAWTENGVAVYTAGKGIITAIGPSGTASVSGSGTRSSGGGGGGSGGGGGGGGNHNSSTTTFAYTVTCIDSETGSILGIYSLTGIKGTTLVFDYEFDGYEFLSGNTTPELTQNNQKYELYYKKIEDVKDDEKEETSYQYTIRYIDIDTGNILKSVTNTGKPEATITVEKYEFDGYNAIENEWTFQLSSDKTEKIIYYEKIIDEKETYSYTINYICKDDNSELGYVKARAEEGTTIKIEYPNFEGYQVMKDQKEEFVLNKDNTIVSIYYEKEASEASPSEPDKKMYSYIIKCLDFESGDELATYSGSGEANSEITPTYEVSGYSVCEDYSFTLEKNNSIFEMFYIKDEEESKEVSYTIKCIDVDTDDVLATFTGKAEIGDVINPIHNIAGYKMQKIDPVEIISNNQVIELYFEKSEVREELEYKIRQIDIDSDEELGIKLFYGEVGERVPIDGLELDGFRILGSIPNSVVINALASNNEMKVFYQKENEYNPEAKDVNYTIEFVSSADKTIHILGDITGTAKDGEKIPVYFAKRVNRSDGSVWQAIDDSPKMIKLDSTTTNRFTIKYMNIGNIEEEEDQLYQYCIRYIAEDTGAVLGVNSGYATAGTTISYRSSFNGYGFKEDSNFMKVSSEEGANDLDVIFKRTAFPGPDKNPITDEYDGSEWNIYFVDNEGNSLLPSVSGFSLKDNVLYIDYPNTIDIGDGTIYRAEVESPYIKVQAGTTYKQIFINYTKGDTSDSKLEEWKKKAQEAKNEFYKTTPFEYKVVYRERNSWNDIGLYLGVNAKGSYINIPAVTIDGYSIPDTSLGEFTLNEDGIVQFADYVKYSQGSSNQGKRIPYTINFADADGNELFGSYTGRVSGLTDDSIVDFPVYYPNQFTDSNGNLWEAEIKSPQIFKINALDTNGNHNTVYYRKTYDNPMTDLIVEKETEAISLFREFIIHTDDAYDHEFYLIGKDYNPKDMITGDLQATYGVNSYGNAPIDTFEIDGITYTVCKITFKRTFTEATCTHRWEIQDTTSGGCLISGSETVICAKCGNSYTVILPAIGHVDKNHDTVCDNCGARFFPNNIGDELIVNFKSGSLDIGNYQYKFICVDDNYNGTGKMLYVCEDDITSTVYGTYSSNHLADFRTSDLRDFLNEEFLDGLGEIRDVLLNVDENRISMLSKDQYDSYLANSINQYEFPEGVFLTSTISSDGERVVLTNGQEVAPDEAANYAARPILLLDKPDTSEKAEQTRWNIGDIQARTIGNETYLFRCISESYKDKTNTSKKMALFLCESVIPADIINNTATEDFETMFFGENNNYKYSTINKWLESNSTDALFSLNKINVGVDSSYDGSTTKYKYSQLNPNDLTKTNFQTTQTMYSNLFVMSVEEALQYKEYLWKFENSNTENPETQIKQYCTGYWLRTPQTNTDDKIYSVNLHDGTIEAIDVKATEGNDYSTIGIRPVFAIEQQE